MFTPQISSFSSSSSSSFSFVPTTEQETIINMVSSSRNNVAVEALAGTSKTTTCMLVSEALVDKRILYIAFTKANQKEAVEKFPSHVECRTWHSLAYEKIVRKTPFTKPGKLSFFLDWKEVQEILSPVLRGFKKEKQYDFSQQSVEALKAYCCSHEKDIVSFVSSYVREEEVSLAETLCKSIQLLWNSMSDPKSKYKTIPDIYLKLFQLSNPKLDYDIIFCDEFQDTNPVCLDILVRQKTQIIVVGDRFQSIYAWRGAKDSFSFLNNSWETSYLTESFRFGDNVAHEANKILSALGSTKFLVGKGTKTIVDSRAVIARTNSTLFSYILASADGLIERGEKIAALVDFKDLFSAMYTANTLRFTKAGEVPAYKYPHKQIASYSSWKELYEDKSPEIQKIVKLVLSCDDTGGVHSTIQKIKSVLIGKENGCPAFTITTAHKAKGLQWGEVTILEDLLPKPLNEDEDTEDMLERFKQDQGLNLLYVALTRAEVKLILPLAVQSFIDSLE